MKLNRERTLDLVKIALMTALTIGLSFVKVPFYPVPFSLQTLSAMLAGMLLKKWQGVASQIFYIALGLIGLPVFTQGGGLAYIFNPTFGYILFLPILTLMVSLLYKKLKILGIILPSILLLLSGTVYYIIIFQIPIDKNLGGIFFGFMIIFIPAEIVKSLCSYFLGIKLQKII